MRLFTTTICFMCLMLPGLSCKKDAAYQTVYRGKIFALGCSQIGIDIEGNPGTGTGTVWTDGNGKQHANAANIKNVCYVADKKFADGDEVTFRISKDNVEPGPSCPVLLCYSSAPANGVYVYDMAKDN